MMSTETKDIIDLLAGIEPGSSLDGIRARRLQARENAQKSYLALFEPVDFGDVAAIDRYAVAAFVAGIHGEPAAAGFYLAKLAKAADQIRAGARRSRAKSNGRRRKARMAHFPQGHSRSRTRAGLIYRVAPDDQRVLGARLAAALEHAHLLVFRPRDAAPAAMQALLAAGWSSTAIVTLSQLVAFLSFQVRTIAGLRTLGASLGRQANAAAKAG